MSGAVAMGLVIATCLGITAYLIGTMVHAIRNEKRTTMSVWKNFGLSIAFCLLFLISWIAQAAAQWQHFTDQQKEHGETPQLGDFVADFSASTLENWQSEFLQLFSFTVLTAVLIHKGSAESKDGDERMEQALKRIEERLGTAPTLRDEPLRKGDTLHVVPDDNQGWALLGEDSAEPEGYYDLQDDAVSAGRQLARQKNTDLVIHGEDGLPRDKTSNETPKKKTTRKKTTGR